MLVITELVVSGIQCNYLPYSIPALSNIKLAQKESTTSSDYQNNGHIPLMFLFLPCYSLYLPDLLTAPL